MYLGITPVSTVSNGLYFLTLPLVNVMRVIYTSKGNVEKVRGARYLPENAVNKNMILKHMRSHTVHHNLIQIRNEVNKTYDFSYVNIML
jgi:hypothetical protein